MPLSPEERTLYGAIAALIAFVLAGGILAVANRAEEDDRRSKARRSSTDEPVVTDESPLGSGTIGPLPGVDVNTFVRSRAEALAAAAGPRIAVVSFTEYRPEAAARSSLAGTTVRSLLVAAPGGEPAVVDDVARWAEDARGAATAEKAELEKLLPTVDDPDFQRQYREDITRIGRLLRTIDPSGPIVFGALVIADAEQLRTLARAPGIRVIDVGVDATAPSEVRGLRPEEAVRAGDPPTRP